MRILTLGAFALSLSIAGPVWASGGTPAHGAEAAAHGGEAGHGEAAAGGHGDAHHITFTGDEDHDGTPNWRDGDIEHNALEGIIYHAINFAILIGVLVAFGRPAIRDGLTRRAQQIRTGIDEAAKLDADAKARHAEVMGRLAALQGEIDGLMARAKADATAEELRIIARAEDAAKVIQETARRQIRDEAIRAKAEIRKEAVEAAVQLAEGILRGNVAAADQARLAQEFLGSVRQGNGVNGHV